MGTLRLTLLGKLQIERDGQPVPGLESAKGQALLAYLAITRQIHSRSVLAGLLWGEMPEETARTNLRVVLSKLRKAVGEHLNITRQAITFDCQSDYWLDVAEFEAATVEGKLRTAVDLYRGDFLAGFYVPDALTFEDWALAERERLRHWVVGVLDQLVDKALQRGLWSEGIQDVRRILSLEPWQEEAHRQLMLLLARSGQRSAALTQYETCRRVLAEELGVEPSASTIALYEEIKAGKSADTKAQKISLATPPSPPSSIPLHNLPAANTPFVGRQAEQVQISQLLAEAGCRLLTIVGPGGIGKTRLAQTVAASQLEKAPSFINGIYFVPLTSVRALTSVSATAGETAVMNPIIPAIAEAISVPFSGSTPPKTQLLNALRAKKMLLVLDNFEHLVDYAGLLVDILEQAPGVKMMVTSRESLNLYEEWIFELSGLAYPPKDTPNLETFDSVQLFVQRARRVYLGFSLAKEKSAVAHICQLLEGMPLGIELAAAWTRTLSCREIASEIQHNLDFLATTLRNIPDRQRSLRAVFEHSWQLLSQAEQDAFARLTVFSGGFTGEAAAVVAAASLRTLSTLVDKSLLQRTAVGRYEVHALLRQYGTEKLTDALPVQAKHAHFYADFQRQRETPLINGHPQTIIEIGQEIENVRAAWEWAVDQGSKEVLAKLLDSLASYYELRGWFQDGRDMLERASQSVEARATDEATRLLWGRLEEHLARFYDHLGHYEKARDHIEKSLGLFRQLQAPRQEATALAVLGFVLSALGDNRQAKVYLQESISQLARLGDKGSQANALHYMTFIATGLGERDEGLAYVEDSLSIYRQLGNRRGMAKCLYMLGNYHIGFGNYAQAQAYYEESKTLHQEIGNQVGVADCLMNQGLAALYMNMLDEAEQCGQESLSLFTEFGEQRGICNNLNNLGKVAVQRADYARAREYFEQSLAIRQAMGQQLPIALTLSYLANVADALGEDETAKTHFRQALELALERQAVGVILDTLPMVATYLAKREQQALAVEILTHVVHHPTTEHYAHAQAKQALPQLASTLNPTAYSEAQARGQTRQLVELVKEICDVLT